MLKEDITNSIKQEFEDREILSKESTESQSETRKRLKKKILNEYIYPDDEETVKSLLKNRKYYASLLQTIRIIRMLITYLVVPSILLADSQFPNKYLGFVGLIILYFGGALEWGDKSIVQSNKKRREKINNVLESIGIKYRVSEITIDDPLTQQHNNNDGSFVTQQNIEMTTQKTQKYPTNKKEFNIDFSSIKDIKNNYLDDNK
jgi:hypothetical protein